MTEASLTSVSKLSNTYYKILCFEGDFLKFRISQWYLGEVETEKPNVRDPLRFLYHFSISKNNYCPQLLQQQCLLAVSFVFHDSLPDNVHPLQNCSFNPMDHSNHFLAW